jgi:hypothetical protein
VATAIHRLAPDVTVSLPSTRVDAFTVELIDAVAQTGRRGSFTLAPEAGSQRLRDRINKGVGDEEIARCAELAFGQGWSALKLYFMIGLPGETMEDVLAIAAICRRALEVGRRFHGRKAAVKASVSTFVPKVGTPFQWTGQDTTEEIEAKVAALRKAMHGRGLELRWNDPRVSILEAALGRGDRRLGAVIERAWRKGARLDAWDEQFRFEAWRAAFAEEGLDPAWYAQREIPLDEPLPWAHLSRGVSADFLARDHRRAMDGRTLADCHWGPCPACGVPEASGFRCRTGEDGPRQLLVLGEMGGDIGDESPEAGDGPEEGANGAAESAGSGGGERSGAAESSDGAGSSGGGPRRPVGWRYVGPPGDPRRADSSGRGAGGRRHGSATMWPYNLLGSDMQSKNAGLSGLASLVEAAGGESTE